MKIPDNSSWLTGIAPHSKLVAARKRSLVGSAFFASFLVALGASGATVPLDTLSYNFQLGGGGGGSETTVNGMPLEGFSDDFANKIGTHNAYRRTLLHLAQLRISTRPDSAKSLHGAQSA